MKNESKLEIKNPLAAIPRTLQLMTRQPPPEGKSYIIQKVTSGRRGRYEYADEGGVLRRVYHKSEWRVVGWWDYAWTPPKWRYYI